MKRDINNNKKMVIMSVFLLALALIGGTFAYWGWDSNEFEKTNVAFFVDGDLFTCSADGGEPLVPDNVIIMPASCSSSENVLMREITTNVDVMNNVKVTMDLWLDINELGTALSESENFRYVVTTSSTSCTKNIVSSGNFNGKTVGDKVNIFNKSYKSAVSEKLYLYVWLDEAETNVETANQNFNLSLNGTCDGNFSNIQSPVLDEGMVPVVISDTGVVTAVSKSDSNWYDYENQKWANMVLVNENASGVEGSKSREYYLNNPGTEVIESDILGYYVWIPRYKYKIWTTDVSSTGNEQEIEIEFESMYAEMSLGTKVGEYRTHPAFWWDNDNDSEYDDGELLPGIWVGKFETTGSPTQPTVKPNMAALTNQTASAQFNTSLLFAGGSMNTSTGVVSFIGNTTYGLTEITNSHMMKNSEWGAVAYLSHSKYGINDEVRINNYWSNSQTLTGCGALTENEATSTSCGISYGTPSIEENIYPQSTTGNITGIFDMSGGATEMVMANYNKTAGSSGFSVYPESKYYDNYTSTDVSTACDGGICYGHAFSETNNWYTDLKEFLTTSNVWLYRGADNSMVGNTGVFAFEPQTGAANTWWGHRSVLIPKMNYTVSFDVNGGNDLVDISYTAAGGYEFVVPADGYYQVEAWGAQGGNSSTTGGIGGYGSYTKGNIYVNEGEILYIFVGGQGQPSTTTDGGYNGGGYNPSMAQASGGGATDIRLIGGSWDDQESLKSRIMVAAGGSGSDGNDGNPGGGLNGYITNGTAASQIVGGSGSSNGSFGKAAIGSDSVGAGSGYYGGGSAATITRNDWVYCSAQNSTCYTTGLGLKYVRYIYGGSANYKYSNGSIACNDSTFGDPYYGQTKSCYYAADESYLAGSGSSYISGHNGCISINSDGTVASDSVHYSNKSFINTLMIDGAGYNWTTKKGDLQEMPSPSGGYYTSGVGHSGDGSFRILQSSSKSLIYGSRYGDMPIPTREGYVFAGWYTEPSGGIKITENTVVEMFDNITLYAHWISANMNISYSVNSGTIESSTTDGNITYSFSTSNDLVYLNGQKYTSNVSSVQTINLPNYNDSSFMNISREGYGVYYGKEWVCLSGCKKDNLVFNQDIEYSIDDFCDGSNSECNVVLGVNFAKKYTITYNVNGGTGAVVVQEKLHGYPVNLTTTKPVMDGYYLAGWDIDGTATTPSYKPGDEFTINDNITLYAIWKEFNLLTSYSCANDSAGNSPYDIVYTGDCTVINDEDGNWRVKFLTTGTLTLSAEVEIDVFLVGGGGGGGNLPATGNANTDNNLGGGGGGYTTTVKNVYLARNTGYEIVVGDGGAVNTKGGTSSAFNIIAEGGEPGGAYRLSPGGAGGSGGGGGTSVVGSGAAGGSDGGDGEGGGGKGQGTTTREFGEENGTLYAGGGGGGTSTYVNAAGGAGGGGQGGAGSSWTANGITPYASPGEPNTGGGGGGKGTWEVAGGAAGGSGIVIIRNAR